ncbi:MAG: DUF3786 domain-containing protein [Candidatus Abyssobacteria bacterium SURF_5]|uniref:DUF3786 domain-containing protein n=1 Tax=Abyssobacteria bacterium (strain SURF_5) TaxID=2093360 RepID=A0A3A4NCR5_ABYX5|nr:MAG: DUF3786 domain-containing protein [Candidatus Abyssubacteria bacterium SURF_5]
MSADTFFEQDDKIDDIHWEELKSLDPLDVCRRSLALYNMTKKAYELRLLDEDLRIYPAEKKVRRIGEPINEHDASPGFNATLVSVHYLLRAKDIPMACEYVTGHQLIDGDFFFKGPHALPDWKIQRRYANDAASFLERGKLLGGTPIQFGDAGLEFLVLPRIRISYVLWTADEEFPARAQILFDAAADQHFALDVVWAMCNLVTNKLLESS